jgi:hypothetical protein
MSDSNEITHGPGEDVIDPAAPLLGWLGLGLIGFMALATLFVLGVAVFS